MRRLIAFACDGDRLLGTVDEAVGVTGILIVSGGNEIRCGAHRGMALLAQRLAAAGIPVFRFDRRGVGDSEGVNGGYASSGPDVEAALAAFRREQPQVRRIVGFGNCDAATALLLFDRTCDTLVLANPWLGDESAPPPPAALRRHYARRLREVAGWRSMSFSGIMDALRGLASSIRKADPQPLTEQVVALLGARPTTLVLAENDRTAQVFAGAVRAPPGVQVVRIDTDSHSFAGADEALTRLLLDVVASLGDKSVN